MYTQHQWPLPSSGRCRTVQETPQAGRTGKGQRPRTARRALPRPTQPADSKTDRDEIMHVVDDGTAGRCVRNMRSAMEYVWMATETAGGGREITFSSWKTRGPSGNLLTIDAGKKWSSSFRMMIVSFRGTCWFEEARFLHTAGTSVLTTGSSLLPMLVPSRTTPSRASKFT